MKDELTRKAPIEGVHFLWPVAPAEGDGGGLRPNWYPVGRFFHGVEFRDDATGAGGDGLPSRIVGLTSFIATEGKGVMPSSLSPLPAVGIACPMRPPLSGSWFSCFMWTYVGTSP